MSQMFFHETEEATILAGVKTSAANPVSTKRYDPETVQNVIALALRLQAEHQETLSVEQIEAIGAEVGLDPAFVRLALNQIEAQSNGASAIRTERSAVPQTLSTPQSATRIRKLSRKAKDIAFSVPVVYSILFYFALSTDNHNGLIAAMAFVGAPALAALTGAGLRSKRLGVLSGAMLGTGLIIAAMCHDHPSRGDLFQPWLALTAGGAAAGGLAAAARQYVPRLYTSAMEALARRFPALTMEP